MGKREEEGEGMEGWKRGGRMKCNVNVKPAQLGEKKKL